MSDDPRNIPEYYGKFGDKFRTYSNVTEEQLVPVKELFSNFVARKNVEQMRSFERGFRRHGLYDAAAHYSQLADQLMARATNENFVVHYPNRGSLHE
jgi:hypothetical protein